MKNSLDYEDFIEILKNELVMAMGCTEPISIAYVAAKAKEVLGEIPEKVSISVSGNIIKNVKSVVVPNTNGMRGIEAAAAAGIMIGDPNKSLEVLDTASECETEKIAEYLKNTPVSVEPVDSESVLDIRMTVRKGANSASVWAADKHTNLVYIEKNGTVLLDNRIKSEEKEKREDLRSLLTITNIYDFIQKVDIRDIKDCLQSQIDCNTRISDEGLKGSYGSEIGKIILLTYGDSNVANRAKAKAAAGSDARMSGCELPVVINSGSGNQGITVSVPVIEYAEELKVSTETLYRALALSNLIAIHLKTGIGILSAFCGAVSAGAACGAGIAYLHGGTLREIEHTIVNTLAITSGIICDGAKPSCAAKIAESVDAGILGYQMIANGRQFYGEDGIVKKGAENTINNVYRLGAEGMKETDKVIISIMTGDSKEIV